MFENGTSGKERFPLEDVEMKNTASAQGLEFTMTQVAR